MSAETPKAVVPFTEEWFAYIISTRTEEGAIRCLSMMTQAELQRLRGLLDDARVALDGIASMSRDGSKGRVRAAHAKITLGMMAGIAEDTIAKLKK